MTLKQEILEGAKVLEKETGWRWGQSVFNYVEQMFGVAREVQFKDGIDCFYNDAAVDAFIDAAVKRIKQNEIK